MLIYKGKGQSKELLMAEKYCGKDTKILDLRVYTKRRINEFR